VRRLLASVIALLMLAGLFVPVVGVAAAQKPAKVVFIVGPTGRLTDRFKAQADEAAAVARRYTPDVTKVYSPNATWPVVRKALQGASLVVYMGHGNGWPSQYRDELFQPTQNGFGLNPTAGGDDHHHQYFGEASVGSQVKLAKNAVVLLHHLCYASGNTEPGLPEGTLAQAKVRVDNYAAGFIRAGAKAVIAEAYASPSNFVRTILGGKRSIDAMWRSAPSAYHNVIAFKSKRSAGYVAQMDTRTGSSGFHRSIVLRAGLGSRDVLNGGQGAGGGQGTSATAPSPVVIDPEPVTPSLVETGIKLSAPDIRGLTTAGRKGTLALPFAIADRKKLPSGVLASVRWNPVEVGPAPADPATEVPGPDTEPAGTPGETLPGAPAASGDPSGSAAPSTAGPAGSPDPSTPGPAGSPAPSTAGPGGSAAPIAEPIAPGAGDPVTPADAEIQRLLGRRSTGGPSEPAATAAPEPTPEPMLPPAPPSEFDLVQAEQEATVVEPRATKLTKKFVSMPVRLPTAPGLYRLQVTLHDAEGVAYDAATQALVPAVLVRVVGEFDARVLATASATLESGSEVPLDVRVANLGRAAWGHRAVESDLDPDGGLKPVAAEVVGHWVALSGTNPKIPEAVSVPLPAGLQTGATADATLPLTVPRQPGEYLLILDIVTPERGSLASLGVAPTLVRVTVVEAPSG
jgi:hypothetical protein